MLREAFLDAMSLTAATVTVVTTDGPAGRAGVTVSAMTPVAADGDSPTILVCINAASRSVQSILENGRFCLNILREDQQAVADAFAGRLPEFSEDKFACAHWLDTPTGSPRLKGALAALDCHVGSAHRQDTHHVIFGSVGTITRGAHGDPLVHCNRAYRTLGGHGAGIARRKAS
ncbi:flavin reductase family protein [Oricola indica]|jgi:flavin reductase|uniref:flavin reductase family protein n=1 Tax=Oricola indica TaxID=2872591 RepID=UPI001CBA7CC7|nr:flavin reductase family protein [Oricola indica]